MHHTTPPLLSLHAPCPSLILINLLPLSPLPSPPLLSPLSPLSLSPLPTPHSPLPSLLFPSPLFSPPSLTFSHYPAPQTHYYLSEMLRRYQTLPILLACFITVSLSQTRKYPHHSLFLSFLFLSFSFSFSSIHISFIIVSFLLSSTGTQGAQEVEPFFALFPVNPVSDLTPNVDVVYLHMEEYLYVY